jgi:hypothetical protein
MLTYLPAPKHARQIVRALARDLGWRFKAVGAMLAVLMFWVVPHAPDSISVPLTQLIGSWVLAFILGTLAAILCAWVPAHDDLIRRNEPCHEGIRVRWAARVDDFASASLLRATPTPRARHR